MPEAAIPLVAEEAIGATTVELTAEEIAAQQLLAQQQAAAALQAQQAAQAAQAAQTATNQSVLNTIAQTPVSSAGTGVSSLASGANPAAGGISSLVNTTGGPTTWEQIFSQGQKIAEGSTELGKVANASSTVPFSSGLTGTVFPIELTEASPVLDSATQFPTLETNLPPVQPAAPPVVEPVLPAPTPVAEPVPVTPSAAPPAAPSAAPPVQEFIPPSAETTAVKTANSIANTGQLSGIQTLAKEVGAEGINTTLSGYGNAVSGPTGEMAMNATNQSILQATGAAPPSAPPVGSGLGQLQTNLAGMGSNMPPVQGPPLYPQTVAPQVDTVGSAMRAVQPTPFEATQGYADAMKEAYRGMEPVTTVSGEMVYPQTIGTGAAAPESGGIQSLVNQGLDYVKKNPLTSAMFANTAYNYFNQPKAYEKPKYKSSFNSSNYRGYQPVQPTPYTPQYAHGGIAALGEYSDGGHMLKGPGDGMSDDIPATIANKQPARLANEEFVIPADVVSHLGNGSSEAGAKQLYKMMDRVRQARTGHKKQGKQINPEKYLA